MKKIILSVVAVGFLMTCFAQNDYIKNPSVGIHFFYNDFQTAQELRTGGLASVIRSKNWKNTSRMRSGLAVSYLKGINNNVDFITTASGSFVDYPVPSTTAGGSSRFLLDVTAVANIKLLSDKFAFTPYLSVGAGASKYAGYYGAFIPTGVGLQLNIFDEAFLLINSQYRIPVTENVAYHLYHSIGFAGNISKRKVEEIAPLPPPPPAPVVEVPKDQDSDGIIDSLDKCPTVAGLSKYNGCPIPDTDKDGINDETDKCIDVAGVARYQGCPVPDTDKDGVNDEEDKCPSEFGPSSNFGCPIIEEAIVQRINKAAQNIFFATGSAKLLSKSNASLNNVVSILTENPTYRVEIDGHTDTVGTAIKNQQLSEARANSVKAYLSSKGIEESRMIATGYGFEKPIASNKTAAGRTKNRRVEMRLKNY